MTTGTADPDAPKLIVEVRSGCLDPDDICTVINGGTLLGGMEGGGGVGGGGGGGAGADDILAEQPETVAEEEEAGGGGQLPPQVTREELNLICYNLMIDVLNSQMDLQDIEKHSGLTGNHSADFLAIVNKMLSTVWLSDVSNVLAETLEADELTEAGGCGAGLVTSSILFY